MVFYDWNLWDFMLMLFVGFDNFFVVFCDFVFLIVVWNFVFWVVGLFVLQFVIGFFIVFVLCKWFCFCGFYQVLVFFFWVVFGFFIGMLFCWMFNVEFGVVNDLFMKVGLIDVLLLWLVDLKFVMFVVIVVNIWYGVIFFVIMIFVVLQLVLDEMLEVVSLDGVGKVWQLFLIIILYILMMLLLMILLCVIWIFNFFDIIYVMMNGGLVNQIYIIMMWMINYMQQGNYGIVSVIGFIVVVFFMVFCVFYLMVMWRVQ